MGEEKEPTIGRRIHIFWLFPSLQYGSVKSTCAQSGSDLYKQNKRTRTQGHHVEGVIILCPPVSNETFALDFCPIWLSAGVVWGHTTGSL